MDQQELNVQTAEQDNADFLSGFNAVRPDDAQALPEPKVVEPEPADDKPEVTSEEPPKEASKDEAEGQTFFGMSESQIKSLLERSARVDEIENQLRRAHGKIGELNANLQNLSSQQKPTQNAPAEQSGDEGTDRWAEDFPEVAAIARKVAAEAVQAQLPTSQGQAAPALDQVEIEKAINIAVMDATNEGWRDTVNSQDFTLWIATQPEDVQETYNTTISAKELGKVLKSFDSWKTSTIDRSNRNKQRLEQALIPTGNASKVSHAPTAHDEFLAGFNSVRNQR